MTAEESQFWDDPCWKNEEKRMLSEEMVDVMSQVQEGADVYSLCLAKELRRVEKEFPDYIHIGDPRAYKGDGVDQMPYFGAILTASGRDAISLKH